ncbi:MAG: penicillin-binding protein activator [Alphaproteobacteria bacterium]|nr:penicillin-binding protein activator [Alphaproteobacteria bacterium]
MTAYSLSSTRRKRPYLYGLCKTLYCGVLLGWVLLGGLVACTQAERATPPSTENNPQGFASRIAENTRAFLRALPDRRGKPTAYDSAQEAKSGFFQTPKTDDGRVRIGLLLPSGAEDETVQAIATSLLNAAQLALFDINQPAITLLIKDTKGTENGAIEAAQRAIQEGAKLLIGPVFGTSAKAIAPLAKKANVPVLTFSNDRKIAESGLWVIGFLPEQNLDRIIAEARAQGLVRFAALIPQTPYGERIEAALRPIITRYSGELVQIEYYQEQAQSMFDPVQRLAHYESRKQAWAEEQTRLYKEGPTARPL